MRLDNVTFKGGYHVPDNKSYTSGKAVEKAKEPKVVYIPLHQHVGSPCEALVKVGDTVKIGQKIGDSKASVSAPVHASISGTVKSIAKRYNPNGLKVDCIEIESDGLSEYHESYGVKTDLSKLSKDEIIIKIKEAGIVGMGGAAFPLHSKLITSDDSSVDAVILNGAECEPYLTCDHRIMLENPEKVVTGLQIIMKYLNVNDGYIAIENNKMDAVGSIKSAVGEKGINVATMITKFPQGDSYRIVDSVLGRKVPKGGRTKDANSLVSNVGTAKAAAEAVLEGKPLIERVVTITGSGVKNPKNLLVKIGTTIGECIEQCGGFNGKPGKIIAGGPMTGTALFTLDTPVTKGTTGILVMTEEETKVDKVLPCIKCGKCLEVCPAYLQPLYISAYSLKDNMEMAKKYDAESCISCGSCSYVCPSKRPLAESIEHAKSEIKARRKKS
ncbi:electron transport complex subunit RsxC [Tissierella creatinini]|nr:electron transport complex subunit RsxC [Tissierella creatinini]TJX63627.1 electron transport complex subunit RsxC [Soehngenia saccharolytica]